MTKVINCHHYGGPDKLPPGSVYIGRPSPYGNRYSSKTGIHSREECVAFHRIDLYESLITDKTYLPKIRKELEGKSLGCWCKGTSREIACHGDNFVHVFDKVNQARDYSKSVLFYLMDDLRRAITTLKDWVIKEPSSKEFLFLYIEVFEAKAEIEFLFTVIKDKKPDPEVVCEYIARLVIELELVIKNKDVNVKHFWLKHCVWTVNKLLHPDLSNEEPTLKEPVLKRKRKVK